jgi:hypothetical protein
MVQLPQVQGAVSEHPGYPEGHDIQPEPVLAVQQGSASQPAGKPRHRAQQNKQPLIVCPDGIQKRLPKRSPVSHGLTEKKSVFGDNDLAFELGYSLPLA